MPSYNRGFQLGLLPEKKWDWRTFAASYGFVASVIIFFLMFGLLMPEELQTKLNFHVTELIPRPSLRPEPPPPPKPLPVHAKLLKPAPVFETPKMIVPKEIRVQKPRPQEVEAPKLNNFATATLKPIPGGARPVLIHTGDFAGSSVKPTLNAPVEKVYAQWSRIEDLPKFIMPLRNVRRIDDARFSYTWSGSSRPPLTGALKWTSLGERQEIAYP